MMNRFHHPLLLSLILLGCGVQETGITSKFNVSQSIIDGTPSTAIDHPSTAALLIRATDGQEIFGDFVCSAVLVAPQVVLTAAHCIHMFESPDEPAEYPLEWYVSFYIDVSGFYANPTSLPPLTYKVKKHAVHPDFSMDENGRMGLGPSHDIALLFLERSVDIIWPATIYPEALSQNLSPGKKVSIAGYGQRTTISGEGPLGTRYYGTSYIHEVSDYEMRVGRRARADVDPPEPALADKCYGDSGGPSFIEHDGTNYVVGLTSRSYNLETDCISAGVDIRVDTFKPWIQETCYQELETDCTQGLFANGSAQAQGCTNLTPDFLYWYFLLSLLCYRQKNKFPITS